VLVLNHDVARSLRISPLELEATAARERRELERREAAYRGSRRAPQLRGRIAILVDDGLATGSSMRAAVTALRRREPARIVVAVPVGHPTTCDEIAAEADEAVCAYSPDPFGAVGSWYQDFAQTGDDEVEALLTRAAIERGDAAGASVPER
jgi:predicted phosphoribosyltransferase